MYVQFRLRLDVKLGGGGVVTLLQGFGPQHFSAGGCSPQLIGALIARRSRT